MLIKKKYQSYSCFQNELEWKNVINHSLRRIKSTHVGQILINELDTYIKRGQNVTIENYSPNRSFQYPHFNQFTNTIVIPDSPYFVKVEVLNKELIQDIDDDFFNNIINCQPLNNKLDEDFCASFGILEFQPIVVILFHELVHCLRNFYDLNTDIKLEEYSTIYGINGNTLIINDVVITENSFRKEIGLGARISHNSKDMYIYNSRTNEGKYSNKLLKELFLKEDF